MDCTSSTRSSAADAEKLILRLQEFRNSSLFCSANAEKFSACKSIPQALKRGFIFDDLTARMNSCPSRTLLELEFFRNLRSRALSEPGGLRA
jgi:hypothetical protein